MRIIKNVKRENLLACFLTYVGYMTLTISITLTTSLASNLGLSDYVTQMAMSLSFFTFSISAVLFACAVIIQKNIVMNEPICLIIIHTSFIN